MSASPMEGLQFPLQTKTKKVSTTATTKSILVHVLEPFDPHLSHQLEQERAWRKHYPYYFKALVKHGIERGEQALKMAETGLSHAHALFRFHRDGKDYALKDAMQLFKTHAFHTHCIENPNPPAVKAWSVPYHGQQLQGEALLAQIQRWQTAGIMEASHADALRACVEHPEWFDLSDRSFVLFGAASEAGPLTWLSQWKANIVAIDLDRPAIWQKIVDKILQGNAKLYAPSLVVQDSDMTPAQSVAVLGANLLTQTPEIAAWLSEFKPRLDLAAIAYLDGEKHVRVSMAMDAIMHQVSLAKPDSTLMFMCTPTDLYAIPAKIQADNQHKFQARPFLQRALTKGVHHASLKRFFQAPTPDVISSDTGKSYGIADCMVIEQGPNYAFAKRIQQWRAIAAHQAGQTVSINIAPSTTTQSVVKNPLLKAAFSGAKLFDVEAFAPETTNAIMAALWIHDLRAPNAVAQDATRIEHPLDLIHLGANHGGLWRVAYLARSALPFAALYGFAEQGLQQFKDKIKA